MAPTPRLKGVSLLAKEGVSMNGTLVCRFRRVSALMVGGLTAAAIGVSGPAGSAATQVVTFQPTVVDAQLVANGTTPPTQAQCNAINRRCFNPQSEETSYNLGPLYAAGHMGQGETIAIVDSFGSE